jgi:hypothetical protein
MVEKYEDNVGKNPHNIIFGEPKKEQNLIFWLFKMASV